VKITSQSVTHLLKRDDKGMFDSLRFRSKVCYKSSINRIVVNLIEALHQNDNNITLIKSLYSSYFSEERDEAGIFKNLARYCEGLKVHTGMALKEFVVSYLVESLRRNNSEIDFGKSKSLLKKSQSFLYLSDELNAECFFDGPDIEYYINFNRYLQDGFGSEDDGPECFMTRKTSQSLVILFLRSADYVAKLPSAECHKSWIPIQSSHLIKIGKRLLEGSCLRPFGVDVLVEGRAWASSPGSLEASIPVYIPPDRQKWIKFENYYIRGYFYNYDDDRNYFSTIVEAMTVAQQLNSSGQKCGITFERLDVAGYVPLRPNMQFTLRAAINGLSVSTTGEISYLCVDVENIMESLSYSSSSSSYSSTSFSSTSSSYSSS
jgi:hypothetical protein